MWVNERERTGCHFTASFLYAFRTSSAVAFRARLRTTYRSSAILFVSQASQAFVVAFAQLKRTPAGAPSEHGTQPWSGCSEGRALRRRVAFCVVFRKAVQPVFAQKDAVTWAGLTRTARVDRWRLLQ
jgi:hypothetical protein